MTNKAKIFRCLRLLLIASFYQHLSPVSSQLYNTTAAIPGICTYYSNSSSSSSAASQCSVNDRGQCVQYNTTHYICYCRSGFIGPTCTEDVDECSLSPAPLCANGGNCTNAFGSFDCKCPIGFGGRYCENLVGPCDSTTNVCANDGVCIPDVLSESDLMFSPNLTANFTCLCRNGFTGRRCEFNVDACEVDRSICGAHGRCRNGSVAGQYECVCDFPYQGRTCQLSPCDFYPCENEAQCSLDKNQTTNPSGYVCKCQPGFTGTKCESNVNDCANSIRNNLNENRTTCDGRGVCSDLPGGNFTCVCQTGYAGVRCEISLGKCASNRCNPLGTLACAEKNNTDSGYACQCAAGYTGFLCDTPIDYCRDNPLTACVHGRCVTLPTAPFYQCKCPAGFYGPQCQFEDCSRFVCHNGGACITVAETGPTCACVPGWYGRQCDVPENPCENFVPSYRSRPCQNGALCESQDYSQNYTCYCPPDYYGAHCEFRYSHCLGNLSANQTSSPCHNDGLCVDNVNSFTCECRAGFSGKTCENVVQSQIDADSKATETEIPLSVLILSAPAEATTTASPLVIRLEEAPTNDNSNSNVTFPGVASNQTLFSINITNFNTTTSQVSINTSVPIVIVVEPAQQHLNETIRNNSQVLTVQSRETSPQRFEVLNLTTTAAAERLSSSTTRAPARIILRPQQRYPNVVQTSTTTATTTTTTTTTTPRLPVIFAEAQYFATASPTPAVSAVTVSPFLLRDFEMTTTIVSTSRAPRLIPYTNSGQGRLSTSHYNPINAAFMLSRTARQVISNMSECLNDGVLNTARSPNGSISLQCDCPIGTADVDCSVVTRVTPQARFLGYSYVALPAVTISDTDSSNSNSLEVFMHVQPQQLTGLLLLLLDSTSQPSSFRRGMLFIQNGTLIFEGRCGWARQDVIKIDSGIQLTRDDSGQMVFVRLIYPTPAQPTCSVLIQVDDKRVQAEKRAQTPLSAPLPRQITFDGVFVGGHPQASPNFTGCISEFLLQGNEVNLMGDAVRGWNVVPCGTIVESDELLTLPSSNMDSCDAAQNPCAAGSICMLQASSNNTEPACLCNATQAGQYCQRPQLEPRQPRFFNDPDLVDYISYVEYPSTSKKFSEFQLRIDFAFDSRTRSRGIIAGQVIYGSDYQLLAFIGSLDAYSEFLAVLLRTSFEPNINRQINALELHVKFGPQILILNQSLSALQQNHTVSVNFTRTTILTLSVDDAPISAINLNNTVTTDNNSGSTSQLLPLSFFHTIQSDGRIFIGNVPNSQLLPSELQLLNVTGFRGCINDVVFMPTGNDTKLATNVSAGLRPVAGRNVGECSAYHDWCDDSQISCGRYATCINIGASFQCTCYANSTIGADGRCRLTDPCAENQCQGDALCVAAFSANKTADEYRCVCSLGYSGRFCENPTSISLPLFAGPAADNETQSAPSYITFRPQQQIRYCLSTTTSSETPSSLLRVHILPKSRKGLIFFANGSMISSSSSSSAINGFPIQFALALVDGHIEMELLVFNSSTVISRTTIRSNLILYNQFAGTESGSWIFVEVQSNPTTLFQLQVDNNTYTPAQNLSDLSATGIANIIINFNDSFIGGLPPTSRPTLSFTSTTTSFSGCIANLLVNNRLVFGHEESSANDLSPVTAVTLNVAVNGKKSNFLSGYGVGSCSSDECQQGPGRLLQCQSNGSCSLERNSSRSVCRCPVGFDGERCELSTSCAANQCNLNDSAAAQCIETSVNDYRCSCELGMTGRFCTQKFGSNLTAISLASPASYLLIDNNSSSDGRNATESYIEFEFRPNELQQLTRADSSSSVAAQLAHYLTNSRTSLPQSRDASMIMWLSGGEGNNVDSCRANAEQQANFIGIGLDSIGRIKVVFNLGFDSHTVLVANTSLSSWMRSQSASSSVSGGWTRVAFERQATNVRVIITNTDGFQHVMQTSSSNNGGALSDDPLLSANFDNANGIYFGAFPLNLRLTKTDFSNNITSVVQQQEQLRINTLTFGYFTQRFSGCLRNVRIGSANAAYVDLNGRSSSQQQSLSLQMPEAGPTTAHSNFD